jgi:hypothetical protein
VALADFHLAGAGAAEQRPQGRHPAQAAQAQRGLQSLQPISSTITAIYFLIFNWYNVLMNNICHLF